ncbi:hypothetical protein ETB97_008995 [Aspergillus alliaceus]|uniref:Fatty acyl-CoA reductase n=1 Tax=Petromyces alliaceus TaxID=209559 RepID=A0A8H6E168_PETAA|nr:hypothetical protein ETB97_008995 [Aspergillus burnettii]
MTYERSSVNHVDWYRGKVVFLTGATGSLGGCLLYKLAVQLPTEKVYALCRGSVRQAMGKWEASMPDQIDQIFDSGKVHCIIGDMLQPDFGLNVDDLDTLRREVTIVIHAAAELSLLQDLRASIRHNYFPAVELVRMMTQFKRIKSFLFVSSMAVCTFLPAGSVEERAYCIAEDEDPPESQVASILSTGRSQYEDNFPVPYAQAKYLAEHAIFSSNVPFSVLVIRPSSIGPAIQDPRPFYGPEEAIPVHTFLRLLLGSREYKSWNDTRKVQQDIIVDEIPVDLVANTCLLHIACGTAGIVHAGAQLYKALTVREYSNKCRQYTPKSIAHQVAKASLEQNSALLKRVTGVSDNYQRAWNIECRRSEALRQTTGPIGLYIPDHDFDLALKVRIEKQSRQVAERINQAGY